MLHEKRAESFLSPFAFLYKWYMKVNGNANSVEGYAVLLHCGDLVIFIGSIIVNSLVSIAAGGVNGNFILALGYLTAASLLFYRSQDMEKLADAF